jgi:4-hydroxybenzoate polyprenyltransferase
MDFSKVYADTKATISPYLDLARPYNATAALLAFSVGYYFYHPVAAWPNFLVGFVVVALLHSAFTMQNDLYDLDVDIANRRGTPLTNGLVTQGALRQVIFNTVLVSLLISWFSSEKWYCLAFILTYVCVAWGYNSPPWFGSRRPVMSIFLLGLLYALLPLSFGLASSGNHLTNEFLLFGALLVGIRMSVSILKDFKDVKGDRQHHKRTFYLVFGRKPVVFISGFLAIACYPITAVLVLRHNSANLISVAHGLLALAVAVNIINRLTLLGASSEKVLTRIFQRSFIGENYFEGAILVCLLIS